MTVTGTDLVLAAVCLNVATFALFWWDKASARRGGWRVPERRLLWCAALGGIVGAKSAQRFLRHKTYKQPFARNLNLIAVMQITVIVLIVVEPLRDALVCVLDLLLEALASDRAPQ